MEIDGAGASAQNTPQAAAQDELLALTRRELDERAKAKGLEPEDYKNKGEIVEALLDAGVAPQMTAAPAPRADPGEAPPPVPAREKGPSGQRITDPAWLAMSPDQREKGLELAVHRFVHGPANQNPAQALQDAAAFMNACRNKGLV